MEGQYERYVSPYADGLTGRFDRCTCGVETRTTQVSQEGLPRSSKDLCKTILAADVQGKKQIFHCCCCFKGLET